MCDEFIHPGLVEDHRLSRRSFGLMTAAVGGLPAKSLAQTEKFEKEVEL
jgi:carboxymethylenebutenolidase